MERIYTIPLRREFSKVPRWKKAKKSIKTIKEFAIKHMKGKEAKISNKLNELIWSMGGKKVIPRVKVKMKKEEEIVYVKLPDEKEEVKKIKVKPKEKIKEKLKKEETKKEAEKKEIKKEETKETRKEEVKEKNDKNE